METWKRFLVNAKDHGKGQSKKKKKKSRLFALLLDALRVSKIRSQDSPWFTTLLGTTRKEIVLNYLYWHCLGVELSGTNSRGHGDDKRLPEIKYFTIVVYFVNCAMYNSWSLVSPGEKFVRKLWKFYLYRNRRFFKVFEAKASVSFRRKRGEWWLVVKCQNK